MGLYCASPCKKHDHITCDHRNKCDSCGWNPVVDEYRREKLRELADAGKLVDRELKERSCC